MFRKVQDSEQASKTQTMETAMEIAIFFHAFPFVSILCEMKARISLFWDRSTRREFLRREVVSITLPAEGPLSGRRFFIRVVSLSGKPLTAAESAEASSLLPCPLCQW
jgi:hypothetical protein